LGGGKKKREFPPLWGERTKSLSEEVSFREIRPELRRDRPQGGKRTEGHQKKRERKR